MIAASRRSHPPSLLRLVERAVKDHRLFARGDLVLVACSGGPDSTALLHALAFLRPKLGFRLAAHGVDHGLRPEAASELDRARAVAEALGVPFATTRVEVGAGSNLQERARLARRSALEKAAREENAAAVATAHTADDRAETFLLRLLRGAGPRGLAVLPPRATTESGVVLIRPLLEARRADVVAHLARHRLETAHDPSNDNPRFTRVRVRKELMPLLEGLSPRIVEHLGALADMLAASDLSEDAPDGLGRDQRRQIEAARAKGRRSVDVRVKGGRDLTVALEPRGSSKKKRGD